MLLIWASSLLPAQAKMCCCEGMRIVKRERDDMPHIGMCKRYCGLVQELFQSADISKCAAPSVACVRSVSSSLFSHIQRLSS